MMNEGMFSLEKELHGAHESTPDVHRHPGYEMGERARELGTEIRLGFRDAVHHVLRDPNFSDEFRRRVESSDLNLPPIEVLDDPKDVKERLTEFGYDRTAQTILKDEALLILRIPDPMNVPYRWDAELDPDQKQWDALYEKMLDPIHRSVHRFEEKNEVDIHRLNLLGVHESQEIHRGYYYLFLVVPTGRDVNSVEMQYPENHIEPRRISRDDEDGRDGNEDWVSREVA